MTKRITVASGKGGVGKSMITSSIAIEFAKKSNVVAIDCDVDAPNLALWLGIDTSDKSNTQFSKEISTAEKPIIDLEKCTRCGLCVDKCQFESLEKDNQKYPKLIPYRCEGCGLCEIVCPEKAIKMEAVVNCTLERFKTKYNLEVIQGQIVPGEAESGEVVTEIREYAQDLAKNEDTIFVQDAAAGIGCPVIASLVGSDYVLAVAEPSLSSISDMNRLIEVIDHFKIPFGVVINKYDLNSRLSKEIQESAGENFIGKISYDQQIVRSIVNLIPVLETDLDVVKELETIASKVYSHLVSN